MTTDTKFDHLVVLMMENRSFDHMLGRLYTEEDPPPRNQAFDGAGATMANLEPGNNEPVGVGPAAGYEGVTHDPYHDFNSVQWQLFWQPGMTVNSLPPSVTGPVTMGGFVADYQYNSPGATMAEIMSVFPSVTSPGKEHALYALPAIARTFAVCDNWFASVPASTNPNRFFLHAGTSAGTVSDSNNEPIGNTTIFNVLASAELPPGMRSWSIYHDWKDKYPFTYWIHWPVLCHHRVAVH